MSFENFTLSQKIADTIALKIAQGEFKPGERLLENELTDLFGTSRAPIREAMYILEKESVVERTPRKGVFVKKHSLKEVSDLYDVVYRMTEIALQRVMRNMEPKELKQLEDLVDDMEQTIVTRDIGRCFELLAQLHLKFFELSDNEVLKEMYQKLDRRLTPFRYKSLSHPTRLQQSIEEYKEIVEGLKTHDYEKILVNLRRKESRALNVLEKSFSTEP